MRTWFVVLLLVAAAGVAWLVVRSLSSGMPVESAPIVRGAIREFIDERGKTRLPKTYLVTMPFDGRVVDAQSLEASQGKPLDEGDAVAKGDIVAQVVPEDIELELRAAQAAVDQLTASIDENEDTSIEQTGLEQALQYVLSMNHAVEAAKERVRAGEAKSEFAKENLIRIQALYNDKQVTRERLDVAQVRNVESDVNYRQDVLVHSALKALQAATNLVPTSVRQYITRKSLATIVRQHEKSAAQARLAQVQQNQARSVMRSPLDGTILNRPVLNERHIAAGTVLLSIGRLEELEIEADILSQDVVRVREGNPVEIYGPAIGRTPAPGRVAKVYPAGFTKISSLGVEQQRVRVIIRLEPGVLDRLRKEKQLGVGYRVRVRVFTRERNSALLAPRSALFRGAAGSWQVFAIEDGQARLRAVEIGLLNDDTVEITKGLEETDIVVLAPETSLTDGAKVAIIGTRQEGASNSGS